MSEYWIATAIALFFILVSAAISFSMHKWRKWARSITVHIVFIIAMFGAILTLRQIGFMLVDEYNPKFVNKDIITTASTTAMALIAMHQLFKLINRLTHQQINRGNNVTSARMIARVLKLGIFLILLLLFGEHFGIGLSGLLAFGGIGGIAIGVAGKDMLSNLFSGVMLYFDRPFNIGDWISSPDRQIEGTVVEIGWRITKITTFDNRPLYVPNSVFSSISVENPGRMTNRRITTTIGLRYDDADKIDPVITDIRAMLKDNRNIDQSQTTLVYFDSFGGSALNIMVYCFTKTTVWADWLAAQQEVYLKIIEIVHAHGADFAYPSETIYMQPASPDKQAEPASGPVA